MAVIKKNIGFILSIGPNVGLGHFIRCLKIASEINQRSNIFFFLNKKIDFEIPDIFKFRFKEILINSYINKENKLIKYFKENKIDTVFVDDYNFSYLMQKKIKKQLSKLIIIDDFVNRKVYCDYYVNYKINSQKEIKKNLIKNKSIFKKSLLSESFWIPSKDLKYIKNRNYISISFGNSFDFNKIKIQLKNLLILNNYFKFQIFIGNYCKNYEYITLLSKKSRNIKIIKNKLLIDKYLNKTFLYIGSSGNAIYEMSYLNIPSIFFSLNENQKNEIKNFEQLGHFFVSNINELNENNLTQLVKTLIVNYSRVVKLMNKKKIKLKKNGLIKILEQCKI